jgi:predicted lipid-binding transport protein (Tim44 family)
MKSVVTFLVAITASLALLVGGMDVAEAKRLGGGKSFGSKFSQSQSVNRNSASPSQPQKATAAQQTNSNLKESFAKKGGLMGLLGGLALGGLLGAMFFGGAFDGINFMDVLLFAGLGLAAFMIFRAMTSRTRQQAQPAAATVGGYQPQAESEQPSAHGTRQGVEQYVGSSHNDGPSLDSLRNAAPKGFDQTAFVDGAKNCFARMQKAWDEGDLADIRQFTTDHVFGEIQDQFQNRIGNSQTEIVDLDAELLSANDLGSKQEAIVLFKAQLREDGNQIHVDEVWHFIKASNNSSWQLEGIQQVAG